MAESTSHPFRFISRIFAAATQPLRHSLELRLNRQTFHVVVELTAFHDSPNRVVELRDFDKRLRIADSPPRAPDDKGLNGTGFHPVADNWIETNEAFIAWVTAPLLPLLDGMAPPIPPLLPGEVVTVKDYYSGGSYDCTIGARDDVLALDGIKPRDVHITADWTDVRDIIPHDLFSIFTPDTVEIVHKQKPRGLAERFPADVTIRGAVYTFETMMETHWTSVRERLASYETVARAGFPNTVRVTGLVGVVVDPDVPQQVVGFVFPSAEGEVSLDEALRSSPRASLGTRRLWAQQLCDSVAALHAAGIVWCGATEWNISVGEDGIQLGRLGEGCQAGFVDVDKIGTMEGDLQGVEALVKVIMDMNEAPISSKI